MGCNQFSKAPVISTKITKSKIIGIIKAETTNTLSTTNLISHSSTLKIMPRVEKVCLKILISKPFNHFLLDDLNNLDSFSNKLHNIRKFWLLFKALQANFESQVHRVCIPDYSLRDGLAVLVVCITMACGYSAIKFTENSPFISVSLDLPEPAGALYKSWSELANLLSNIEKKGHVSKVQKYLECFNHYLLNSGDGSLWHVRQAIKLGGEFVNNVQDTVAECIKFVKDAERVRDYIEEIAKEANSTMKNLPSQIVHNSLQKI